MSLALCKSLAIHLGVITEQRTNLIYTLELRFDKNYCAVAFEIFNMWLGRPEVIRKSDEEKASFLRSVFSVGMAYPELNHVMDSLKPVSESFADRREQFQFFELGGLPA